METTPGWLLRQCARGRMLAKGALSGVARHEIIPTVVIDDAIGIGHIVFGPSAGHVQPSETTGRIALPLPEDMPVMRMDRAGNIASLNTLRWIDLPLKDAILRIVFQDIEQNVVREQFYSLTRLLLRMIATLRRATEDASSKISATCVTSPTKRRTEPPGRARRKPKASVLRSAARSAS